MIAWDLLAILKDQRDQKHQYTRGPSPSLNAATEDDSPTTTGGGTAGQSCPTNSSEVGYQAYAQQGHEDAATAEHGSWGPSLTRQMSATLPFVPDCTLFLGSPLGIFLTLRGAHAVFDKLRDEAVENARIRASAGKNSPDEPVTVPSASPFTLPTGDLINIFHPSDPVAYRIEPLLLQPDMSFEQLPPPVYLTAPGKEVRLHLKAKQFGESLSKNLNGSGGNLFGALISTLTISESTLSKQRTKKITDGSQELVSEWPPTFPLSCPKNPARVDYSLQTGVVDSEYISAVTAHSNYFTNTDLHDFLIARLGQVDESLSTAQTYGLLEGSAMAI